MKYAAAAGLAALTAAAAVMVYTAMTVAAAALKVLDIITTGATP